jgi:hypothetical protein
MVMYIILSFVVPFFIVRSMMKNNCFSNSDDYEAGRFEVLIYPEIS